MTTKSYGLIFDHYHQCPECNSDNVKVSRCEGCGVDSKECLDCGTKWQEFIEGILE